MSKPSNFVTTIELNLADKLKQGLISQGFEITCPQYTLFLGKKKGVSCTLYESGKLMVQGKDKDSFIEFFLEPEILQSFDYSYQELNLDTSGRIGIDESGKGDFFGPLCVGGVFASGDDINKLKEMGVKDSKAMKDITIRKLAKMIRKSIPYHIVRINPAKYNEIYPKFKNLNNLLAWGHATTIEQLHQKTHCKKVIVDQFASEHVVETALKRKNIDIDLTQRHKAEEDVVVAAASIMARDAFLEGMETLGKKFDVVIPRGASKKTLDCARKLARDHGADVLQGLCKLHFKSYQEVMNSL